MRYRRQVFTVYNARQEDFGKDAAAWIDYQEDAEDLILQLMEGGDQAASARQKLDEYNRKHRVAIANGAARHAEERRAAAQGQPAIDVNKTSCFADTSLLGEGRSVSEIDVMQAGSRSNGEWLEAVQCDLQTQNERRELEHLAEEAAGWRDAFILRRNREVLRGHCARTPNRKENMLVLQVLKCR